MPYEIKYDSEGNCLMCRMFGEITYSILPTFASDADDLLGKHDCHLLLNDLREADLQLSTLDLHEIPKLLSQFDHIAFCKRALVVSGNMDDYQFFETVSVNRGDNVKIFRSFDEAEQWLFDN